MISDLENGNEELAENLEEQLRKSIIRAMMADKYKEQVRKLYETWAEYGEDGYTKDEVDALREMQKQLSEAVLAERDSLADIFGWSASGDSYSQSSSTGYTTTMSQETGEEISGRLTAMYESNVRLETKRNGNECKHAYHFYGGIKYGEGTCNSFSVCHGNA